MQTVRETVRREVSRDTCDVHRHEELARFPSRARAFLLRRRGAALPPCVVSRSSTGLLVVRPYLSTSPLSASPPRYFAGEPAFYSGYLGFSLRIYPPIKAIVFASLEHSHRANSLAHRRRKSRHRHRSILFIDASRAQLAHFLADVRIVLWTSN